MTTKFLEIRDKGTCIPALALRLSSDDGWLVQRAGFGAVPMVYLVALATTKCNYDPWAWDNRTMHHAHLHIVERFDVLADGDVVDVRYLLSETTQPAVSDQRREQPA